MVRTWSALSGDYPTYRGCFADVELDGKFVGNTPTTLRLKPGEYTITVRKAGFAPWTRKLAAIPDNELKITAELKKD
jgi:hypothetical protein